MSHRRMSPLCDHCHVGRVKMHAGEIETDSRLVRWLLRHQFPHWADLPIEMVPSYGTDHDIYRLGDQLCARMPRIGWAAGQAEREAVWLPRLAPHLPLALPVQVALGQPADGYPFTWSVYQFAGHSRKMFLSELGADDDAYLRGRGWTLYQAITGLYYWDTNPGMIRQASHALAQVLAET